MNKGERNVLIVVALYLVLATINGTYHCNRWSAYYETRTSEQDERDRFAGVVIAGIGWPIYWICRSADIATKWAVICPTEYRCSNHINTCEICK